MRRATWVWTRPDPVELVEWSTEHGFGELFLGVSSEPEPEELAWARRVRQLAGDAGITVSALGGDDAWLDRPQEAVTWVRAVLATGIFDGVHVDLEPWNRDDWLTGRSDLVARYLTVLRSLAAACPLPLEADIAFWLFEVPAASGISLDAAVMRIVDSVTVLSLRNTATGVDSVVGVAANALAAAGRVGIPCRLAVETRDLGADPLATKQTFHDLGPAALETVVAAVDNLEAGNAAYNGVAIKTSMAGEAVRRRWRAGR